MARISRMPANRPILECIGGGQCGSVWATLVITHEGRTIKSAVIKAEQPGSSGIRNEATIQSLLYPFHDLLREILVPRCYDFIDEQNNQRDQLLRLLPAEMRQSRVMVAEKIEPVSREAQWQLFHKYWPEDKRDELNAFLCHGSQHCLPRLYLGRRLHVDLTQPCPSPHFNIRNFPIHLDQAVKLHLPCQAYAKAMAQGLATLHWGLRANGANIEFVLGAPRRRDDFEHRVTPLGLHLVWMLGFDLCEPIRADEAGLESIARAFWQNNPYFPRPDSAWHLDQDLWRTFADEYRRVGTYIVQNFPQRGENVGRLAALVPAALTKIVETRGRSGSERVNGAR